MKVITLSDCFVQDIRLLYTVIWYIVTLECNATELEIQISIQNAVALKTITSDFDLTRKRRHIRDNNLPFWHKAYGSITEQLIICMVLHVIQRDFYLKTCKSFHTDKGINISMTCQYIDEICQYAYFEVSGSEQELR